MVVETSARVEQSPTPSAPQPCPIPSETKQPPVPQNSASKDDAAWLNDLDLNGAQDTLMMRDNQWNLPSLNGTDAYVYGKGGCFNSTLSQFDRISSSYGYYQINFSKFKKPCTAELTLIASVGKDGASASSNMNNWYWWQNTSFCFTGSPLCQLQKNGTVWEEWLIRVSWDPTEGLKADGNGYTKNTQLK